MQSYQDQYCAADNVTHRKFNSYRKAYHNIRRISDCLCRQHGLSVIEPEGKNKRLYAEWKASGTKSTWREKIKKDIDAAIAASAGYPKEDCGTKKLIDTSSEKFARNPGLGHLARLQNLKVAAEAFASAKSVDGLKKLIDNTQSESKRIKSRIASLDRKNKELKEVLYYMERYKETLPYQKAYEKSRKPDKYLRMHEAALIL